MIIFTNKIFFFVELKGLRMFYKINIFIVDIDKKQCYIYHIIKQLTGDIQRRVL